MRQPLLGKALFITVVAVIAFAFVLMRGQDRNWDLLNYHFFTGYSLLNGRLEVDIAAANLQSFFNPLVNVFSYLAISKLPFPFSAWSILSLQLLAVPGVMLISREIGKALGYPKFSLTEVAILTICLLSPLWWSELGTTFFSSTTAPLLLFGFSLILRESSPEPSMKYGVHLSGALIGLAVGLKLTNAPFAVAATVCLIYAVYPMGWRCGAGKLAKFVVFGLIGFGCTAWWNWYLWVEWSSPIFPMYNSIFRSPYADLSSMRDMRWYFSGIQDFLKYIVESAFTTSKTSEIPFADPRLMIIGALLPGAIMVKQAHGVTERRITTLILFCTISFLLWASLFAYQRYLIPLELLAGLIIWIQVSRLVLSKSVRMIIVLLFVALFSWLIKIPDWGHAKTKFGSRNPFEILVPKEVSDRPARYLIFGVPVSYVLPYFHPESQFFGVSFNKQVTQRIESKIQEDSTLPLGFFVRDAEALTAIQYLDGLGYSVPEYRFDCSYLKTGVGRYLSCVISDTEKFVTKTKTVADIYFSEDSYHKTSGVLWESGLSYAETWGRWSSEKEVIFGLTQCLPEGKIQLQLDAYSFPSVAGRLIYIDIGGEEKSITLNPLPERRNVIFLNTQPCINRLTVRIPNTMSPSAAGLSTDSRNIGVGFIRLRVLHENTAD